MNHLNQKGFTLLEVIVVTAVLGILSSIGIPLITDTIDSSKISHVQTEFKSLQTMLTDYYSKNYQYPDASNKGLQKLIEKGLIQSKLIKGPDDINYVYTNPDGNIKDYRIEYTLPDGSEKIIMTPNGFISDASEIDYNFANMDNSELNNEYLKTGTWEITDNKLIGAGDGSFSKLFFENNKDEYVVKTKAKLTTNGDTWSLGGYGIFIDTKLEDGNPDDDTGYIMQFDKHFGKLVFRERTSGMESSPFAQIDTGYDNSDSWWNEKHNVIVEVSRKNPQTKTISVTIDGVNITDEYGDGPVEYESTAGEGGYTGLRTWAKKSEFDYVDVD